MALNQTEFEDLRASAQTSRQDLEIKAQDIQVESTALKQIELAIAAESSKMEPDTELIQNLNDEHATTQDRISNLQNNVAISEATLRESVRRLVVYEDPRSLVGRLNDSKPVFLLPVRVETRFMTVKHVARISPKIYAPNDEIPVYGETAQRETLAVEEAYPTRSVLPFIEDDQQLWVRIFPDDIAVNTHEPNLTESEYEAGKNYWIEMWYAGEDSSLEIGAWRGLTGGIGSQRAAWVAKQTTPTNPGSKPTSPVNRVDPLPTSPIFPTPALKNGPWTEAPKTKVMPDCFVIRLYNGTSYREIIGNPVPDPLQLSIDPNDDENAYDFDDGKFDLPSKIKWLTDMDEAVKVGMALKIDLQGQEASEGFDRILVLGVKYSTTDSEGQQLLENLIDNHHYTDGGISLVQQGTATNNTETARSGYSIYGMDEEETFRIEMGGPLFTPTNDDKFKTDGQHLAEALGLDYDIVDNLGYADGYDIKDAMCMNRALWPATMGYYLSQIMHPTFTKDDINKTKEHYNQFVLGRGRIPSIRVDDQPYGILPTTAFSRWKEDGTDARATYRSRLHSGILNPMDSVWTGLVDQVKHSGYSGSSVEPRDLFMDVLGLHANSVEFRQHFSGGPFFMWNLFNFYQVQNQGSSPTVPYMGQTAFENIFTNLNFNWLSAPRIFGFGYLAEERFLNGPVIDSLPLSEKRIVEKVGNGSENYLKWLKISDYNTILFENFSNIGASGANPPNALLYLMLRHACLLEYVKTGINMLIAAEVFPAEAAIESEFMNIVANASPTVETRNLIMSFVEVELGVPREADLEDQTEVEFQIRESKGQLEDLTPEQITEEKVSFKNNLRVETQEPFDQTILQESSERLEQYEAISSHTGVLREQFEQVHAEFVLADYISVLLDQNAVEVAEMNELRDALNCLMGMPTARLERSFVESIDTVNYRLDAWYSSLVAERLNRHRMGGSQRDTGIYLGAYSWLEDLRPSSQFGVHVEEVDLEKPVTVVLTPQEPVPPVAMEDKATENEPVFYRKVSDRAEIEVSEANIRDVLAVSVSALGQRFTYLGSGSAAGIVYDPGSNKFVMAPRTNPDNQGFIHSPSMNHATTAAVLRAGYNAHHDNPDSPDDALAVNLTSERVRRAMTMIEGIRNGQELSALLGYLLERGLHDREEGLDMFILDIRNEFPLVANRVVESSGSGTPTTVANEAEAYNVVDGLKLVEASRDPYGDFPYGVSSLNTGTNDQKTAIKEVVAAMHDTLDATNDLLLAESVYQVVQGNHFRAGATLDSLSGKSAPLDPEILQSPRSKQVVGHRVGLMLDMQSGGSQAWTNSSSARSIAEPHLNRYLGEKLPDPANIRIAVEYRALSAAETDPWTQNHVLVSQLNLQPIDLFYILSTPSKDGEAVELVNRVAYRVNKNILGSDDHAIKVLLKDKSSHSASQYSIYELVPVILQLAKIIGESKPMMADDFILPTQVDEKIALNPTAGYVTSHLEARLNDVLSTGDMSNGEFGLGKVITKLTAKIANIDGLDYNSLPGNESTLLINLRNVLFEAAAFSPQNGIPPTAIDFSETNAKEMASLGDRVKAELNARLVKANAIMGALVGLTEKKKAEKLIEASKLIFGKNFKVFPEFTYYDASEFEAARTNTDYLDHAGPLAVEEWTQGVAMVRKKVAAYQKVELYSNALLGTTSAGLKVAQLPLTAGDNYWLGVEFPDGHEVPDDNLSLILQLPAVYDNSAAALHAGFIMDEWIEEIPEQNASTGIAIHYDNPNSEPPQVCLLAVTPEVTGNWKWDDLMETLNDTLDWAKKRAVDPDLIKTTPLSQVLPATMAAISGTGDTPSLDYGRNIVVTPPGLATPVQLEQYESIFEEESSN